MTPFYDVLTVQPSLDARQIVRKQMKLAMSVGKTSHYAVDYIQGRHFIQTAERAGLPGTIASDALEEIFKDTNQAMKAVEKQLPSGFPEALPVSVRKGFLSRLSKIG